MRSPQASLDNEWTLVRLRVGPADQGLRAEAFVCRELPLLSRARVRQKIQEGEARLNGHRFATSTHLRAGDELVVPVRVPPLQNPRPALRILYEDEHLVAFDKPAGIASHPMGRLQVGTVIQEARQRDAEHIRESLGRGDTEWYPRSVNRLDVGTSGVVLVALTLRALHAMQELQVRHLVHKEYVALVEGVVPWDAGTILLPLGPDPQSAVRVRMAVLPEGLPSVTTVRVQTRLPRHSVLHASPVTGRQHQVRVHLAATGYPVVGDLLYIDESRFLDALRREEGGLPLPRHFLHASVLSFTHPVTGRAVRIASPLPPEFLAAVRERE